GPAARRQLVARFDRPGLRPPSAPSVELRPGPLLPHGGRGLAPPSRPARAGRRGPRGGHLPRRGVDVRAPVEPSPRRQAHPARDGARRADRGAARRRLLPQDGGDVGVAGQGHDGARGRPRRGRLPRRRCRLAAALDEARRGDARWTQGLREDGDPDRGPNRPAGGEWRDGHDVHASRRQDHRPLPRPQAAGAHRVAAAGHRAAVGRRSGRTPVPPAAGEAARRAARSPLRRRRSRARRRRRVRGHDLPRGRVADQAGRGTAGRTAQLSDLRV
ncbi:MAG: Lysophospholipid Acyltransferases (LPLATs) of Glycerophospholipid Biosynthesis: MGAT-like, partial [uncultured Solirubrobacterales bacterium]